MPNLDGQAAAQKLLAMNPYHRAGLCLEAVYRAFGGPAWNSNRPGFYTYADRARQDAAARGRISMSRDIPAGAVVYLTPGGNGYGHICISLGGDAVVSTDTPSGRSIGITTITALCNKWGRQFAGWSDTLMGHQITNLGPTGANPAAVTPDGKLRVDGRWGMATTRRLQDVLGTPADGVISFQYNNHQTRAIIGAQLSPRKGGSLVVRRAQAAMGLGQDGWIGPGFVSGLQRRFGTPVDGRISLPNSMVVRAMQTRLNEGRF